MMSRNLWDFAFETKKEKTKPKDFAMCLAESKRQFAPVLFIAKPLPNILKKKLSIVQLLFNLVILFIICMSPAYLINVYRSSQILVNKDKFILKKHKIDSISTTNVNHGPQDEDDGYIVFFNNKKEKLHIKIVDENRISFSKRTKKVYQDFEKNILKENGWMGRKRSDSINIWQGAKSNLYGLKDEKKFDVTSYRNKLIINILLLLTTIFSVWYFLKYKKNKQT